MYALKHQNLSKEALQTLVTNIHKERWAHST